jgi:hypothetical protein
MTTLPIPEGFTPPQEPQFEISVVVEMGDGVLNVLAIEGIPLTEAAPEEAAMPEGEQMSFQQAVEKGMR